MSKEDLYHEKGSFGRFIMEIYGFRWLCILTAFLILFSVISESVRGRQGEEIERLKEENSGLSERVIILQEQMNNYLGY